MLNTVLLVSEANVSFWDMAKWPILFVVIALSVIRHFRNRKKQKQKRKEAERLLHQENREKDLRCSGVHFEAEEMLHVYEGEEVPLGVGAIS
ncbi:MAG: hypothetical protein QG551_255 [Patescibacteria group bacterium]|nr:hypothetical protein [Patescibacteria group bacterium]